MNRDKVIEIFVSADEFVKDLNQVALDQVALDQVALDQVALDQVALDQVALKNQFLSDSVQRRNR